MSRVMGALEPLPKEASKPVAILFFRVAGQVIRAKGLQYHQVIAVPRLQYNGVNVGVVPWFDRTDWTWDCAKRWVPTDVLVVQDYGDRIAVIVGGKRYPAEWVA